VLEDATTHLTLQMAKKKLVTCDSTVPSGSGGFGCSFFSSSERGHFVHRNMLNHRDVLLWMRYSLGSLIIINLQIALNVLLRFLQND